MQTMMHNFMDDGWIFYDGYSYHKDIFDDINDSLHCLTKNQHVVANLILDGYSCKNIANHLSITVRSVHRTRNRIILRLKRYFNST